MWLLLLCKTEPVKRYPTDKQNLTKETVFQLNLSYMEDCFSDFNVWMHSILKLFTSHCSFIYNMFLSWKILLSPVVLRDWYDKI